MTIGFSRGLAFFIGALTPLLETVRRWNALFEEPPSPFDDYLLGAFLLYGAWRVGKDPVSGQRFLTAAWGVAFGMVFLSFFGQIDALRLGEADPAPVASEWVLLIKGVGFLIIILGLISSLRKIEA